MGVEMIVVSVRMNKSLIRRLKKLVKKYRKKGSPIEASTISAVIRLAISTGLDVLECDTKK